MDTAELNRLTDLTSIDVESSIESAASLPAFLKNKPEGTVFEREQSERYLCLVAGLQSLDAELTPRLVPRHSLNELMAAYSSRKWLLALLTLGGIALIICLSWRVERTIAESYALN